MAYGICKICGCRDNDPFIGTGTTAIVAHQYSRHFLGYEINKEYFDFACNRIAAEKRQLRLWI